MQSRIFVFHFHFCRGVDVAFTVEADAVSVAAEAPQRAKCRIGMPPRCLGGGGDGSGGDGDIDVTAASSILFAPEHL